ncbi:hypothetical protein AYO45_02345 [Gammaproteobacteria bacterium SCGC AG-212-F23]|nr:hypothetical protein AYO45_02345 [Gammaproteobacteria bacterium SCGC AG-212-F23]
MLTRLSYMKVQPQVILDVGCGTGQHASLLQQHYPHACIIALDKQENFLQHADETTEASCLLADTQQLPLRSHSVDMIFANLVLPWCLDLQKTLKEWQRVLRQDGLLMFTSLGPDTLRELMLHEHHTPNFFGYASFR